MWRPAHPARKKLGVTATRRGLEGPGLSHFFPRRRAALRFLESQGQEAIAVEVANAIEWMGPGNGA